jgi:hypothetical protein
LRPGKAPAVPASATQSAITLITSAGAGRRVRIHFIEVSLLTIAD